MADYLTTDTELTSVANAIRTKGGTSASLVYPAGFVSAIEAIPTGGGGTYQTKTNINPTTSSQTITPDSGYDALSSVQINAMPSGTAGTPTATKGTVSNHAVSVTPSVTNTTGYITGSTKTGTAVSVSASELVSGTLSITENGTGIDVANYAAVDVNVSGGGSSELTKKDAPTTSGQSNYSISFPNLIGKPKAFYAYHNGSGSTSANKIGAFVGVENADSAYGYDTYYGANAGMVVLPSWIQTTYTENTKTLKIYLDASNFVSGETYTLKYYI